MSSFSLSVSSLGRHSLLLDDYPEDPIPDLLPFDPWHTSHNPLIIEYTSSPPPLISTDDDCQSSSSTSPATPSYSFSGLPSDSSLLNYYYSPPQGPIGLGIDFSESPIQYQESLADFCLGGEKPRFNEKYLALIDTPVTSIMSSSPTDATFCDPKALELPEDLSEGENVDGVNGAVKETTATVDIKTGPTTTLKKRKRSNGTATTGKAVDIPTTSAIKSEVTSDTATTDAATTIAASTSTTITASATASTTTTTKKIKISKPKSRRRKPELKIKTELPEEPKEIITPAKKRRRVAPKQSPPSPSPPVAPPSPPVASHPPLPPSDESMESDATVEEEEAEEEEQQEQQEQQQQQLYTPSPPISHIEPPSPSSPISRTASYRRGRKASADDGTKPFICEACNRTFKRQEHLKRHHRSLHTREKPYECEDCGKSFSRSDNLAQHVRIHARTGSGQDDQPPPPPSPPPPPPPVEVDVKSEPDSPPAVKKTRKYRKAIVVKTEAAA